MAHYDFLTVLCPSAADETGRFPELTDDGLYLGGQTRMAAAVLAFEQGIADRLVVVGGDIAAPTAAERRRKVRDMQHFLVESGIPKVAITGVISQANTLGNMRALYVTHGQEFAGKRVGIFSNDYHLQRAMRIATNPQFMWEDVTFEPVAAEDYVPVNLNQFASELARRRELEDQGVRVWDAGEYDGQALSPADWQGQRYLGTR